jgi:hypothetical protein
MRILMFAALLGSGLCAQTPPDKPFEPAPEPQAGTPAQTSNPAALEQKQRLDWRFVWPSATPDKKGGLVLPAIVAYAYGHAPLVPRQACAIPLINVAPKGGFTGDPKIAILGSQTLTNIDHMPLIPSAPPCPEDKR